MKNLLIKLINKCGLYTEAQMEEEIAATWTAATYKGQWTRETWKMFLHGLRHGKLRL
jgi:hypothetical protein